MKFRNPLLTAGALLFAALPTVLSAQLSTVRSFSSQELAVSTPVEGTDGAWYGTLYSGGTHGAGAIYRITSAGAYSLLYSFTGGTDGGGPVASMSIGSDGNWYGTTSAGGENNTGTLYELTTAGVFTSLYSFPAQSGSNGTNTTGAMPYSSIIQDASGNWWGTASAGGANGWGTVFKYSGGTVTVQHAFTGTDGQQPFAPLVQDTNGNFFGVTTYGGNGYDTGSGDGCGTVYRVNSSGTFRLLYSFKNDGVDGCNPVSGLTQPGSATTLFGTTAAGGANGTGTVYSLKPGKPTYTQLSSFTLANIAPGLGPLLFAGDGKIYGTTLGTNICSFVPGGCGNAVGPFRWIRSTRLAHAIDRDGGVDTYGTLYNTTTTGTITTVYSFTDGADGATPIFAPLEGSDGNLYGTTLAGGVNGVGALYKYTANLAPLVSITAPASVTAGTPFTLSYTIGTAGSTTDKLCYASGAWTGRVKTSGSTTETLYVNVPATFALTCGGNETAYVVVLPTGCAAKQICFSSLGHNFGAVGAGITEQYGVQVQNTYTAAGKAFPIVVSLSGDPSFKQTNNCPASLAPGSKCEIIFTYTAPATPGYQTATINITPTSGFTFNPSSTGTLRGQSVAGGTITLNTQKHNFGGVSIGNTATFGWIISNGTGTTQPVSFTPNGDTGSFTAVNNCGSSIAAGATCSVVFTFTPNSTAWTQLQYTINTPATVTFDGNDVNTLTLIGYGVQ